MLLSEIIYKDFNVYIEDLLNNEKVKQLNDYNQHLGISRLEHSISVAYITFRVLTTLKISEERVKNAVRAALLHDLFLYDWRTEQPIEGNHAFVHPKIACETANTIIELNDVQKNIILSHMFPLGEKPKSLEAWVVQYADKQSAILEYSSQYKEYILDGRALAYMKRLARFFV